VFGENFFSYGLFHLFLPLATWCKIIERTYIYRYTPVVKEINILLVFAAFPLFVFDLDLITQKIGLH
jgi:hypothetical protein